MKNLINLLLIILVTSWSGYAQLNPKESAKSLVQIQVTGSGKPNVCTGFIWQKDAYIVTSLHAMKTNGKIKVYYLNEFWRDAEIVKVLPEADLVLLKTNIDVKPISKAVKPIKDFYKGEVKFREKLYAQGYHGGAIGHRTQELSKGDAYVETLEFLIVSEDDKKKLVALGFPKIDLPVYYLNGSLLPGYSGSPIYNDNGDLVAIGDGGLENGQINVSWAIPAHYLANFENTNNKDLPARLDDLGLLFSAKLQLDTDSDDPADIEKALTEDYTSYGGGGEFEFYKTKTRSFQEMYNSSFDPENLDYFAKEFTDNKLFIDYQQIMFDVYEDVNNGVLITLPEGSNLVYDPNSGAFAVDLSNYDLAQYFALEFVGLNTNDIYFEDVDQAVDMVLGVINGAYGAQVGGFTEDENYSYSMDIDDNTEIAYILYQGNNNYQDEYGNAYNLVVYLTVLLKDNKVFYSIATITMPVSQLAGAFANGIDCVNNYENSAEYCEFFEMLMRVVASTHMTAFANKRLDGARK